MKLYFYFISIALSLAFVTKTTASSQVYHCARVKSKNCVIANISAPNPSDSVTLPDLSDKTALHIKEGQLPCFSRKLADQLGNVQKLQLGPLGVRELFLLPQLIAVEADENQIATISFAANSQYSTEILRLSGNRLSALDGFEVLVLLKELWLSSNALESVNMAVFQNMKNLEKLALDRNRIAIITAASPIALTQLNYVSFADNKLSKLDVSNWEFESLTVLDVSGNDLITIENFQDRFITLQSISMARNPWYCTWLDMVLQKFAKGYVTVKDSDQDCEGSSRVGLCCLAELDGSAYDENFLKLQKLHANHIDLKTALDLQLSQLEINQDRQLGGLKKRLDKLTEHKASGGPIATDITEGVAASDLAREKVLEIKDGLSSSVRKFEMQTQANTRIQQRLGRAIVELKRTLERDTKNIAELQAQFGQLKDHVRNVLEKRDILDG